MKLFCLDHNQVLADLKHDFEITKDIDSAERVVLWNDVNSLERGIISYAKSRRIPTIVIQHGRKGTSKYFPPFNEKIQADRLLVWGPLDKQSLIEAGQDERKITVVGSPIVNKVVKRAGEIRPNSEAPDKYRKPVILFSPEHWDRPVEENLWVRDELRKLKGVKIITKIIDSASHQGIDWDHSIVSYRDRPDHLEMCCRALAEADLIVGVSESTLELCAQALNKPVVIFETWNPKTFGGDSRYYNYRRVISSGSKKATLQNLLEVIKDQLANPQELVAERRAVCLNEGGVNLNAYQEIKKAITTLS